MEEKGIKPARGTMDIDFAMMIPDMDVYEEMKRRLIANGFRAVNEPYRLIYEKTDTVIDLLPFGAIEQAGTVRFTERDVELSVIGMKEVTERATNKNIAGVTVSVSPLEGIIILKLIAYDDKPERTKDVDDITTILNHYFEINEDRFYAEHLDGIEELSTDHFKVEAGARLAGRDIKKIIERSGVLRALIIRILESEIGDSPGSMGRYMLSRGYFAGHRQVRSIFSLIYEGIKD